MHRMKSLIKRTNKVQTTPVVHATRMNAAGSDKPNMGIGDVAETVLVPLQSAHLVHVFERYWGQTG